MTLKQIILDNQIITIFIKFILNNSDRYFYFVFIKNLLILIISLFYYH